MQKRNSLTKAEKSWVWYDWANSVYATNMMAAIFPIYFASVAGDAGDKWWGIGISAASLIVAILAPILGAVGDFRGMKKRLLTIFLLVGVLFTVATAFLNNWKWMLIGYILSHIGYSGANIFYDSFLTDVTSRERMDTVSSWGYAMGYLGGSTIPFVLSIALLLATDFSTWAVKASILLTSIWWLFFSWPLLKNVHQTHYVDTPPRHLVSSALGNLWHTLRDIASNKGLLLFMLAYFFYIDGVNTIISLATSYGTTLGLGSSAMILALLMTQLIAVPFSLLFSRLAKRFGAVSLILTAVVVYFIICLVGFFMGQHVEPYQLENTRLVDKTPEQLTPPATLTRQEQKEWETILNDIKENGKEALAAEHRTEAFYSVNKDGVPTGVFGHALFRLGERGEGAYHFATEEARSAAVQMVEAVRNAVLPIVSDAATQVAYREALAFSALLFWLMAVLVGTVQGGIQALSRSHFGKLIPADRSSEFFGFFDIFGKFAAVIGPFLYAAFYMLTGRASIGIISLMLLFSVGGVLLAFGRGRIQEAENAASHT